MESDKILRKKLFMVVNVDWFFLSHRVPIAREAQRRGYDLTVFAMEEEGKGDEIRALGFHFVPLPSTRGGTNIFSDLKLLRFLYQQYRHGRPDIVHHFAIKPVLYGSLMAKWAGVPRVVNSVTGFGSAFVGMKWYSPIFQIVNKLYKYSFKNPNIRAIVQNEDDRKQLLDFGSLAPEQVFLIKGSGVDLSEYSFSEEMSEQPVRVILPARMLYDKGVGEFAGAAKILKKKYGSAVEFILAGKVDPENKSHVPQQQLENWTAEGHVQWIGNQEDMVRVHRESNIVCLPSYREGVPKALIEAAAIGRPIVTTDAPGCRVVVEEGINGFKVPVGSIEPLADALEKLILDKKLRLKMGRAGRALAEREFSVEMVLERTFEIYEGR